MSSVSWIWFGPGPVAAPLTVIVNEPSGATLPTATVWWAISDVRIEKSYLLGSAPSKPDGDRANESLWDKVQAILAETGLEQQLTEPQNVQRVLRGRLDHHGAAGCQRRAEG